MKTTNLLRFFLFLALLVSTDVISCAADFEVDGISYTINSNGVSVSVARGEESYSGDVVIPSTVTYEDVTYTVTSIPERLFSFCDGLNSLYISSTVTYIADGVCGYNNNLVSIVVDPDNPKYDSRDSCNAIIETATNKIIAACNKTVVPNTVKIIGQRAFSGCYKITALDLPNSVESIEYLGYYQCSGLKDLVFPESVKSISHNAFDGCSGLTSVHIPKSVEFIGRAAFNFSENLVSLVVDSENPRYDSRNDCNAIIETATNTLLIGCKLTEIPNEISTIAEAAFYRCGLTHFEAPDSLKKIERMAFCYGKFPTLTIPDAVTMIDFKTFSGCDIRELNLGKGVTSIGYRSFEFCGYLTSLDIPDQVVELGYEAFYGCSRLKKVRLGKGLQRMSGGVFHYINIDSITCYMEVPPAISDDCFKPEIHETAILRVPFFALNNYRTAPNWQDFIHLEGIEAVFEVDGIYYLATSESTAVVVSVPDGEEGYSGNVNIPSSVTYLGMNFDVTGIDANAFDGCYDLTSIVIAEGVASIGAQAFQGCTGLKEVTMGSGMTMIGAKAFNYCNALERITCRDTVPPVMENANCFTNKAYSQATLVVPRQHIGAYQSADFWYKFASITGFGSIGLGDVDGDGIISVSDITALVDLILGGEMGEGYYPEFGDMNNNGRIDVGDVTTLVDFILHI